MATAVLEILALTEFLGLVIFFLVRVVGLLNPVFYLGANGEECFFDVLAHLGGGLYKFDAQGVGEFLALLVSNLVSSNNLSLFLHVTFVAHQDLTDLLTGVLLNFDQPVLDVLKTLFVSYVVDQDDAVRPLVIRTRDYLISLLVLNRSYPAVSQICIFTCLPAKSNVLILKSTPIVGKKLSLNIFSEKRSSKLDLPTEELPTNNNLKR